MSVSVVKAARSNEAIRRCKDLYTEDVDTDLFVSS